MNYLISSKILEGMAIILVKKNRKKKKKKGESVDWLLRMR